ncbi:MAG: hypothetical protein F6K23_37250 [Okeania sp. SIO2C9]|uniref:hypothetical protein n=1 Tax=Okeania sp. SIO2C9 TaxID=2607791 RepID=UPI0013C1ED91|nr:hypothetical protein [Okeania sp. SIO2C9]NEQ78145.1 hypothetical protein [Okeania sp. SIO2C9]
MINSYRDEKTGASQCMNKAKNLSLLGNSSSGNRQQGIYRKKGFLQILNIEMHPRKPRL